VVIEAERLREIVLLAEGTTREREPVELLETLLLAEAATRERERVELLETLAERLPDLLREA